MTDPLVSVIVPTYNQLNFIAEALDSVLEQDYENLQIVVGDDRSTDGTVDIIHDYAKKYPRRLIPLVGLPHLGITGNCNRCLRACNGKYIAFHAGDDVFLPGKIRKQVEWLEADSRRVLCGHDIETFESKTGKTLSLWSRWHGMKSGQGAALIVKEQVPYGGVSIMLRSSSMPPYGYEERVKHVSDWMLWIECLASGGHFGFIDGVYARYRRHDGNITARWTASLWEDEFIVLALVESRYPHLATACRFRRAGLFYELAKLRLTTGNTCGARAYLLNSLAQAPWYSWKVPLAFILSYLPIKAQTSIVGLAQKISAHSLHP